MKRRKTKRKSAPDLETQLLALCKVGVETLEPALSKAPTQTARTAALYAQIGLLALQGELLARRLSS